MFIETSEEFIKVYPRISVSEAREICDQHDTPFEEYQLFTCLRQGQMINTLKFFRWLGY